MNEQKNRDINQASQSVSDDDDEDDDDIQWEKQEKFSKPASVSRPTYLPTYLGTAIFICSCHT